MMMSTCSLEKTTSIPQVPLEHVDGLVDQRGAGDEEQDPLDQVGLRQLVDQRDHGADLAGSGASACRHHPAS